jgi:hypothetical protein
MEKQSLKSAKSILSGTIIAFILCTPAFAFAKENDTKENNSKSGNNKSIENEHVTRTKQVKGVHVTVPVHVVTKKADDANKGSNENKNKSKCLKAFGHLIAPGWIKNNGALSLSQECTLPAGIKNKFPTTSLGVGTSTDTTIPLISNILITPSSKTAVITWATNEPSDSTIFYSTTTPVLVSASATLSFSNSSFLRTKSHRIVLRNLTASTTYYAVIRSRDALGNTSTSTTFSFVTGTNSDVTPPTITNVFALVSTSTVKFTWTTNEPATTKVFYSTTTPVTTNASTTPFVEDTTLVNAHTITVSGLTPNTTYHFVTNSKDFATNSTSLAEFTITTNQ